MQNNAELAVILNCDQLWQAECLRPEYAHLEGWTMLERLASFRLLAKVQAMVTCGIATVATMKVAEKLYRKFLSAKQALYGRDVVGRQRSYGLPLEATMKFRFFGSYEHGEEPFEVCLGLAELGRLMFNSPIACSSTAATAMSPFGAYSTTCFSRNWI